MEELLTKGVALLWIAVSYLWKPTLIVVGSLLALSVIYNLTHTRWALLGSALLDIQNRLKDMDKRLQRIEERQKSPQGMTLQERIEDLENHFPDQPSE